ncbi:MAG: hypothetical protein ACPG51_01485 [Thiolinea sp.]
MEPEPLMAQARCIFVGGILTESAPEQDHCYTGFKLLLSAPELRDK